MLDGEMKKRLENLFSASQFSRVNQVNWCRSTWFSAEEPGFGLEPRTYVRGENQSHLGKTSRLEKM